MTHVSEYITRDIHTRRLNDSPGCHFAFYDTRPAFRLEKKKNIYKCTGKYYNVVPITQPRRICINYEWCKRESVYEVPVVRIAYSHNIGNLYDFADMMMTSSDALKTDTSKLCAHTHAFNSIAQMY